MRSVFLLFSIAIVCGAVPNRRIFLTSQPYVMNGGIAALDQICTNEAGEPAKALVTDETGCGGKPCRQAISSNMLDRTLGQIDWPLFPNTTYYNNFANSSMIATTDCFGFLPSTLQSPVQTSNCLNQASGMDKGWMTRPGATCNDWTSTSMTSQRAVGWLCPNGLSTADLLQGGFTDCSGSFKFLCVTNPPSPSAPPAPCGPPALPAAGTIDFREVFNYNPYIAGSTHALIIRGQRLAVVINLESAAASSFQPNPANAADVEAMRVVVYNLERMLAKFDEVVAGAGGGGGTGRVPLPPRSSKTVLWGHVPYELSDLGGAAGLAGHGTAGVAIGVDFWKTNFNAAKANPRRNVIHHVFWYETMRNYIFPDVFTRIFDYNVENNPSNNGWVNQGFVNVVGCLFSNQVTPVVSSSFSSSMEFEYFGRNRQQFMDSMLNHLTIYMNNSTGTFSWDTVFMKSILPWDSSSSLDNLYSGLLVYLYRNHGEVDFLKRFFRALPVLLPRAPASKFDAAAARDNFFLAASVGANSSLLNFFTQDLRFSISTEASQFLSTLLNPPTVAPDPPTPNLVNGGSFRAGSGERLMMIVASVLMVVLPILIF